MEEEKISIIMSAYNAEQTIGRAIESCLIQTYSNFELIIVNDCSTDSTLAIAEAYKDNRIKIISNKQNEGAGFSRAVGIENLTGKYTLFLDSDDFLEPELLETLYNNAKFYNADIVQGSYHIIDFDKCFDQILSFNIYEGEAKYTLEHPSAGKYLLGVLIDSKLWEQVEYSKRRYIEDTPTLVKLLYYANKKVTLPYIGYNYVCLSNSLTHEASNFKNAIFMTLCAISNYEFGIEKDIKLFKSLDPILLRISTFEHCSNKEEAIKYKNELKEIENFIQNILKNEKESLQH